MKEKRYLIADLGASNGRVLLGSFDGKKIRLETLERFENFPVAISGTFYWDFLYLYAQIKIGINHALVKNQKIVSIAVDTWGLDFTFTDHNHEVIANPVAYRDPSKKNHSVSSFHDLIPLEEYFQKTGWTNSPIGPPFYLHSLKKRQKNHLHHVHKFLMMPDLFNFLLTSVYSNEYSIASDSMMINYQSMDFDEDIIGAAGLKKEHFSQIVEGSHLIGKIQRDTQMEEGAKAIHVVACASHDTASAVVGIPAVGEEHWAFVSLGTYSVFGTETAGFVLDQEILEHGLTNEGITRQKGFLAKNTSGLWIIQQCMQQWKRSRPDLSYQEIDRLFPKAEAFSGLIDVEEPSFSLIQPDMSSVIRDACQNKGFPIDGSIAAISRCIYESLILNIKYYFRLLEKYSQKEFKRLFLFGGGSKNRLFCQWLADALGIRVMISNPESTSIGNLCMQLIADRQVKDIDEARRIVKDSFEVKVYEPEEKGVWDQAYGIYIKKIKEGRH